MMITNIIACDHCDIGLLPREIDNGHCPECGAVLTVKTGPSRREQIAAKQRET